MYSDAKKRIPGWVVPAAVLILLAGLLIWAVAGGSEQDLAEEGAQAIRTAVQRGALQCYTVEGVYPPDLQYLEENYGLQVNTRDYYVTYDAFASNLPPNVIVQSKHGG